ncbi:MAG: ATP-binding domain-containing protein, partial [Myxococcales bacterium]|nr:ATP-binding domain-containing protein [Myxococcales bacterium]
LGHPIVEDELALLGRVTALLEDLPEPRSPSEQPVVRELERLREAMISGSESKDMMSLTEQWHRQTSLLRQLRRSKETARVDPRSPYFAHLRLVEDDGERDLCLGRATCIERGVRIVDWRNAPISRIFYGYREGDDYEETFGGRVRTGEVVARRTVRIRDGVLDRIESPDGVFVCEAGPGETEPRWNHARLEPAKLTGGEASALRAHESGAGTARRLGTELSGDRRRADKRLPEITSLIDAHQFDLITRERAGFLVIRGTAGSGKTTVALHRIAYLAYDDPGYDSERTLFLVFSAALQRYVEHVLPSLGVKQVRIETWRDWATTVRRRHYPALPRDVRQDTPIEVSRAKLHPALELALARQVATHPGPSTPEQALDDWASVLTHQALLRECFEEQAPGLLGGAALDRFVDWNRRRNEEVFGWLDGDRDIQAELDAEDDALLLRAWQLRVGPLQGRLSRPLRYRHVAIDEVQDFAPLEVRVLLDCLDDQRSLTLAGDTQQHLMAASGFTSWSGFLDELGVPGTHVETLRVSYRSSREIASFAQEVLGPLREDEPPLATRSGPEVELFRFTDRGATVAFLADALRELAASEPLASVAVLTPSRSHTLAYHDGLSRCELPRLRLVADQDFTFAPGVEVTEVEQSKGLEFDYVVLVDADAEAYPEADEARRRLHVGATRAVHQLWLTSVGTPSPLVAPLVTLR